MKTKALAGLRLTVELLSFWSRLSLPPLCWPGLTAQTCSRWTPDLRSEFGDAFLRSGRENSPVQIQKLVFSAPTPENANDRDVNTHTDRLLLLFIENLAAPGVQGGARCVSGPALVRTAPALPTPWNPNLHAPSGCPSLTADSANHNASRCHHVTPSPNTCGRGDRADWLVSNPWANHTPHVLRVHQCRGSLERRRGPGVDDGMFNFN